MTAEWRKSRRVLASTLASIGDAVLATDREGRITFLNPVAEALTGWSGARGTGKAVEDVLRLIDERTRGAIDNPLMRALHERAMVTADGAPTAGLAQRRRGADRTQRGAGARRFGRSARGHPGVPRYRQAPPV